jgi:hypothetical protein
MTMKKLTLLFVLLMIVLSNLSAQNEPFTKRTVVTLPANSYPWECVYGPNDSLFITESRTYLIKRIRISNGNSTTLLNLSGAKINFNGGQNPQGGLMGLALHPALYSTDPAIRSAKPYVYVAYVYQKANSTACSEPGPPGGCVYTTKIERYEYRGNALINPVTVLDNIPGSSDHNSGRLVLSPVIEPGADANHTQYRLYYTVGDMGAGQFFNTNRAQNSQVTDNLAG